MRHRKTALKRRIRNNVLILGAVSLVAAVNAQPVTAFATDAVTTIEQASSSYKAKYGDWQTFELPEKYRVNGVHSVMLPTGKVLIVAGSGNDRRKFESGSFKTILWDPVEDTYKDIYTPEDVFCSGHSFLPNGNVLVAGGTRKYEVLKSNVKRAAGVVTVVNDAIYEENYEIRKGDLFIDDATGLEYAATEKKTVPPVEKLVGGGKVPTKTPIWVEAKGEGAKYAFRGAGHQLRLKSKNIAGFFGLADTITLAKQEYRGLDASYEFNPTTEEYEKTGSLRVSRWYPSLVSLNGGDVLAVSGLDEYGVYIGKGNGKTVERYDVKKRTWSVQPQLDRAFPTYPALFRTKDGNLFYSGSSTGYGSAKEMRTPGTWDLKTNKFSEIPGLREPGMNETSTSVLLPPAQDQRVLFAGGGAVGDRRGSTKRVDVIDIDARKITPAPDLPQPVRYPSSVVLPNDQVLLTGGSRDYRGRGDSNVREARLYNPGQNTMSFASPPQIGRNYHSEALLLPDARVLTVGSDSLYGDKANDTAGKFEQRVEIYSPPYLFTEGARPTFNFAPQETTLDSTFHVDLSKGDVAVARLVRPSAVTHVTDTEQRSVALEVTKLAHGYDLKTPAAEGILPLGWYMLFVTDSRGVPSKAHWIQVK